MPWSKIIKPKNSNSQQCHVESSAVKSYKMQVIQGLKWVGTVFPLLSNFFACVPTAHACVTMKIFFGVPTAQTKHFNHRGHQSGIFGWKEIQVDSLKNARKSNTTTEDRDR